MMKAIKQLSLFELADCINHEHLQCEQAFGSMLQHAKTAGEYLIQAKNQVPHGGWMDWVAQNCKFKLRTATNYMNVAKAWDEISNSQRVANLREALAFLSENDADEPIDMPPAHTQANLLDDPKEIHAIAAAKPKFQIGDWVTGIDFNNGGVVEGAISRIGNKYLVLESGINITNGTATVLKPATPTLMDEEKKAINSDLAPIQTPETIEVSLPPPRIEEDTPKFKKGNIVAGFYNPTNQYEVGELESYSSSAYSLLVTSDGRRCGVVTDTLRDVTPEEEDAYYYIPELDDKLPESNLEPSPFKKGDRVTGEFSVSKEIITGEVIGELGDRRNGSVTTVRADDGRVWGLTTASLKPAPEPTSSKMDVHYSSESVEHYTPPHIITSAIAVLGKIVLDPCSNSHHSPSVPSVMRYTKADDGLAHTWLCKTLYMNPPYGDEISAWVDKLCVEYEAGNVEEAIALVPSRTDTQWFNTLSYAANCVCFVRGRLKFGDAKNSAPFPSAIAYLGQNFIKFRDEFNQHGSVWVRLDDVDE